MQQIVSSHHSARRKMVRKQVYILPHQELALKERAQQQSTTEADLIRQAVETYLNQPLKNSSRLPPDEAAWQEILNSFEAVLSQTATGEPISWTRADFYDDPRYQRRWSQ